MKSTHNCHIGIPEGEYDRCQVAKTTMYSTKHGALPTCARWLLIGNCIYFQIRKLKVRKIQLTCRNLTAVPSREILSQVSLTPWPSTLCKMFAFLNLLTSLYVLTKEIQRGSLSLWVESIKKAYSSFNPFQIKPLGDRLLLCPCGTMFWEQLTKQMSKCVPQVKHLLLPIKGCEITW